AEDGIRDYKVTGVQTCALPICEQVNIIRQRVSSPVNMNFFCHKPVDADPKQEAGWKARLAAYYRELGLDPAAPFSAANRAPFDRSEERRVGKEGRCRWWGDAI